MDENPQEPTDMASIDRTADIVAAYVGHNTVAANELAELIRTVHDALQGVGKSEPETEAQEPAVSVRSSVKSDSITCLECGKRYKVDQASPEQQPPADTRRVSGEMEPQAGLSDGGAGVRGSQISAGKEPGLGRKARD